MPGQRTAQPLPLDPWGRPNITTTATNGELGKMVVVVGDTVTDAVRWSDFAEGTYTGTTARNGDEDLAKMVTTGTLVDTITYRNLEPGKEYTAAGEFQAIVDGNAVPTSITGSVTFTAEAAEGTVDVTFRSRPTSTSGTPVRRWLRSRR